MWHGRGDDGTNNRKRTQVKEEWPLSVYGRTKLGGERAVLTAMPDAHVVRTAWIYEGADGSDFVAAIRRAASGKNAINVVTDQIGSPTYVGDLCLSLLEIADSAIQQPVLHAANVGATSRFEHAQAIFERVGADPSRVHPVTSENTRDRLPDRRTRHCRE